MFNLISYFLANIFKIISNIILLDPTEMGPQNVIVQQ